MSLIVRICYNLLLVCLIQCIYIYFTTQEAVLEEKKYCNAYIYAYASILIPRAISIEPERIIPFNAVYMLVNINIS